MILSGSSLSFPLGFFKREECSERKTLAVANANLRVKLSGSGFDVNATDACCIRHSDAIPGVVGIAGCAKNRPSVVRSIPETMIGKAFWPFARHPNKGKPVGKVKCPVDLDLDISVVLDCSCSIPSRAASARYSPCEQTCFWIVVQQFSDAIRKHFRSPLCAKCNMARG